MTSEEEFGIVKQPEDTCPYIDEVLAVFKKLDHLLFRWEKMDEEDLRDLAEEIERSLWGVDDNLEKIRTNCEAIRYWGKEWKEVAKMVVEK